MKRILTLFALFLSVVVTAGNDLPVNGGFKQSFEKHFPGQQISRWGMEGKLTVAFFVKQGVKHRAYFDANASLLAVSKDLTSDALPMTVHRSLVKRFGDFGQVRVLEYLTTENEYFYLLDIYHHEKVYTIQAYPYGGFEVIRKIK